jgi:hypothetical protein
VEGKVRQKMCGRKLQQKKCGRKTAEEKVWQKNHSRKSAAEKRNRSRKIAAVDSRQQNATRRKKVTSFSVTYSVSTFEVYVIRSDWLMSIQ